VNDDYEDVVAYNDIVDYIEQDDSWDGYGNSRSSDISAYNLVTQIIWDPCTTCSYYETGEVGWEPYTRKTRPACTTQTVTVAIYAEKHGLLDTPGNFRDSRNEPRPKRLIRCANKQSYIRSTRPYTCTVPGSRDYEQAVSIDEDNKNTKWQDSTTKEFREIDEYETFNDKGKDINLALSTRSRVHLIYAVMTVATRHVSWQEDISLKHHRLCVLISRILSEVSV
jgi:hypothetical protein